MYKVSEVPLKSSDPVALEVPLRTQFVGVSIKNNIPVVLAVTPTTTKLTERVELLMVESGAEFGSEIIGDKPIHIGSFQHASRVPNPEGADKPPVVIARMMHVFMFKGEVQNATSD